MTPYIYLAFRFHGNFYHSYRGDTPDELGFGKDIRIIRHLIRTLDDLNAAGIPIRGTWDFENYFSLQTIMPEHCPDLIAALQRRAAGGDEMELMAYNNGLISGHTAREFEAAIRRGITNAEGSGLADLFGEGFRPIVRPQEMMYTPMHLKLYRALGIEAISLYYSALPFNAFSNFVPPLPLVERYNPLTLTYPRIDETLTLLPCYNNGDLADHLTLRRWLGQMRKEQLAHGQRAGAQPVDLLLLIDMDADDEFWAGYNIPLLKRWFSTIGGLRGLVQSVAGLDYVRFTTPGRYLDEHPPVGSICIGQDTADGAFDGYSSWAEKWSNHRLWTGIEVARILDLQTRRLAGERLAGQPMPQDVVALLDEAFEARLKLLSTTYFGMAAPVMNRTREAVGRDLVRHAVDKAAEAFKAVAPQTVGAGFSVLDYPRGQSTAALAYAARPARALMRLRLHDSTPRPLTLCDAAGRPVPCEISWGDGSAALAFVDSFAAGERKDYALRRSVALRPGETPQPTETPFPAAVAVDAHTMSNERLRVRFDPLEQITSIRLDGVEFARGAFLHSGLTYGGKRYQVEEWQVTAATAGSVVGTRAVRGSLTLPGGEPKIPYTVQHERIIRVAAGLPYLYVTTSAYYRHTLEKGFSPSKAKRLQREWDARWQEVWPCEIRPNLLGTVARPLRVWKHNYCDHVSSFTLDYGRYSKNDALDSINNQVTHGWVAVSDGERGVLVACSAATNAGMAFCPLRTRREADSLTVRLNPFGTYWGKQYDYATADTGLGKLIATAASASDHITPYAPSYNGRPHIFSLMIAPYSGDAPPEEVRYDAEAFAYPPIVLSGESGGAPVLDWNGEGLGEEPLSDYLLWL